jgi:hypothetical protein
VASSEVRFGKVGSGEICASEIRIPQERLSHIRSAAICAIKIGLFQTGTSQDGIG